MPEKPSEEAQKAEEAVDAAGQGQEKRPDKALETGGPSGATGQLQETPPGEASKTGKAGGDGVQPLVYLEAFSSLIFGLRLGRTIVKVRRREIF